MDKATAISRMAETAWDRILELRNSEVSRRSSTARPPSRDAVLDRWESFSKQEFLSAWSHVSAMANGEILQNDYALFLMTMDNPSTVSSNPHPSSSSSALSDNTVGSTTGSSSTIRKAMNALAVDVSGIITILQSDDARRSFREQILGIEGLLIACLGHHIPRPRSQALKLLNALYDGVPWQVDVPLEPVISFVNDDFVIDLYTTYELNNSNSKGSNDAPLSPSSASSNGNEAFRIIVSAPSFDTASRGGPENILTMHIPQVTKEEIWVRCIKDNDNTLDATAGTEQNSGIEQTSPQPVPSSIKSTPSTGGNDKATGVHGLKIDVDLPSNLPATAANSSTQSPSNQTVPQGNYLKLNVTRLRLRLAPFTRCGFYDWRAVVVNSDGSTRPLTSVHPLSNHEIAVAVAEGSLPVTALATHATNTGGFSPLHSAATVALSPKFLALHESSTPPVLSLSSGLQPIVSLAQGRYIVHRNGLAQEHWHQVIVDLEGMRFSDDGDIIKHGTFDDLRERLRTLKSWGVTSLYILGSLERDNAWGEREPEASASNTPANIQQPQDTGAKNPLPGLTEGGYRLADGSNANNFNDAASDGGNSGFGWFEGGTTNDNATPQSSLLPTKVWNLPNRPVALKVPFGLPSVNTNVPLEDNNILSNSIDSLPSGYRAYAMRPDANPHAVVDRLTPNRMLGGHLSFIRLIREAAALNMRVAIQCDAAVSASRPHRKYKHLYAHTLDTKGQAIVHAGTDGLENQWEDTQLLNYRKVETWELLVSEAKHIAQNLGVGGLYLSDAQSYPFIMALDTGELFRRDVDGETHYTPREMLEGEVVISNQEIGVWSTKASRSYPNPLLVKLVRSLWHVVPDFSIIGESHWGRSGALARSGILPHTLDLISAVASTLGRSVDKNGIVTPMPSLPADVGPVHFLRALMTGETEGLVPPQAAPHYRAYQERHGFPNPLTNLLVGPGGPLPIGAQNLQLRSLSSARHPYPALLFGRTAWTGADLLYTLPGIPCTFQDERIGRAYRVDVTGTYRYNESYMAEERTKKERRLRAEKHNRKWLSIQGPSLSGNNSRQSIARLSIGNEGNAGPSSSSSPHVESSLFGTAGRTFDDPGNYEGHVGAGGVVPGPRPPAAVRPLQNMRSGFSHLDLQELAATAANMATGFGAPSNETFGSFGNHSSFTAAPSLSVPVNPPPVPSTRNPMGIHGSSSLRPRIESHGFSMDPESIETVSSIGGGFGRHGRVMSTPALRSLFLENNDGSVDMHGEDSNNTDSTASSVTTRPVGTSVHPDALSNDIAHRYVPSHDKSFDEDEDDDDDDMPMVTGKDSAQKKASGFGFHVAGGGAQRLLPPQQQGRLSFRGDKANQHTGKALATNALLPRDDMPRIQSWASIDAMRLMGGEGNGTGRQLRDGIKAMQTLESRLRAEVGPEYGFDLAQIAGHYDHRRGCRNRYRVLRDGLSSVLTAHHRFGEHGHVFAFARYLPSQVAVVACNFNGHPSTFSVNCSSLAAMFGATTMADASASVGHLMTSSLTYSQTIRSRFIKSSTSPSNDVSPSSPLSITLPLPSLNLRGGVWEVRDIFQSENTPTPATPVSNLLTNLPLSGSSTNVTSLSDGDGPLIAILTSDEAAYAPVMTTLAPHRSYCWLYNQATSAYVGGGGRTPSNSNASPLITGYGKERETETDPAAMQWLFASSLMRLQAMLRMKECGLSTAIITVREVELSGGYEAFLGRRDASTDEPWISPGEMLKDEEIQTAVRHNLVYSLIRHVVKRTYRGSVTARRASTAANEDTQGLNKRLQTVMEECADMLEAALRVIVTHCRIREGPEDPHTTRRGPNLLRAEPLPPLHGNSNVPVTSQSTTNTKRGVRDLGWYCIDAEAAVVIVRAAMFLAVKDVVAQAKNTQPTANTPTKPESGAALSGPSDVSDDDANLSALLVRAMVRVSRGLVTGVPTAASGAPANLIAVETAVLAFAKRLLWRNNLGPIVFVTPELGKWSTVGGLGVMVDELSVGLAELGAEVICISPYYNVNRRGVADYLRQDGITYSGRNVSVWVGGERIDMGVHEGVVNDVRVLFLHNALVFPRPYPPHDAFNQVRVMSAFARGTLETLCQWRLIPSLIITNDWFTGLVPAYARNPKFFSSVFNRTDFMHICHNLDPDYEGRLWPDRSQGFLAHLHELDPHLLVDPHWSDIVINPTRAALLCSDTWATVSRSYRTDLLAGSPLRSLLRLAPHPFAHPNGIPVKARANRLAKLPNNTHEAAKAALQKKYFNMDNPDPSLPLFAFVGRITAQKGVHLILAAVDNLLRECDNRCLFLVGGMASESDSYGRHCAGILNDLRARHPKNFWADPAMFFVDGDTVNLGADFCMMPSVFEPGGIVQQEFYVAGTPVIAFKTGGLKDTVINYNPFTGKGTGFTFEAHTPEEFSDAVRRALTVYANPEAYANLRANSRAAVMDLSVVSLAWFREFHRVRRCLPPGPRRPVSTVNVKFTLRVNEVPVCTSASKVELCGSFNGWKTRFPLILSVNGDKFETTVPLAPGTYTYKYVIDTTHWITTPDSPSIDDGTGVINNVINVLPPPSLADDE